MFQKSLFIFRRDLRLEDNTGLIFALKNSKTVIPAFIFTPEQIENNPYRNDHCLKFMIECLIDLEEQLKKKEGKLFLFEGKPEEIISQCIKELNIDAVIVNRDYTPYSQLRDQKIEQVCKDNAVSFHSFDDALLHPPEETLKQDGKPYSIFTPYFRNASKLKILPPQTNCLSNYFHGNIPFTEKKFPSIEPSSGLVGGRTEALKILKKTHPTHLSPYLKFTVCSPREVYKEHPELIRSLYWRDFFTGLAFFFPHVFTGAFHTRFDSLKWSTDQKAFQRWCEGTTGFPLVDAAMREMNQTGFMPNRQRMIAASFLVKDLHIDWRWGERYFAIKLIDYDPAVNNGNWQWVASVGCDSQPYFRVFNPWTQQKKFDPDCAYIKKWIPELRDFPATVLHTWYEEKSRNQSNKYPNPITDHNRAAKEAIQAYKALP